MDYLSSHELSRRGLIRGGMMAALGAAFAPQWAFARAPEASIMPNTAALLARWVGPDKLPGLVATLGLPGRDPAFEARGSEGFGDPDLVTPDSLFRIYSMTKPITGMAAMMLIDEGRLRLDQPLSDILPKFARMRVQDVPDGSITELHPAKAAITIRHLLTHTSGLGYSIIQTGPLSAAYRKAGLVPGAVTRLPLPGPFAGAAVSGLDVFADRLAEMPLVYEPGTTWSYSVGLDLMGRVIEVVSGQAFDAFLQERLFDPLGMTSTFFRVPADQAHRLTTNYAVMGKTMIPIDFGRDSVFLDQPGFPFGGAGLVSTPRDYDKFLRMLAQYGEMDGTRVMNETAVRLGTSDLLPPGVETRRIGAYGPSGFGAGGRVGKGAEAGIYGWSGAAGTVGTVDMKRGIRASLFAQFMPPNALPVIGEYQQALTSDVMALAATA